MASKRPPHIGEFSVAELAGLKQAMEDGTSAVSLADNGARTLMFWSRDKQVWSANAATGGPYTTTRTGDTPGSVLTATFAPGWSATGWQAYRDGVAITGATAASYTLVDVDAQRNVEIRALGLAYGDAVKAGGPAIFNWSLLAGNVPVACYATRKLNPASTKFAKIKTAAGGQGTETDVLWDADYTASAALQTKIGAGGQGNVITWYDQSGSGNDAAIPDLTGASYALAPNILAARKAGGFSQAPVAPLMFDGVTQIYPKRLKLPSTLSVTNNSCTVVMLRRRLVSSQTNVDFMLGVSATAVQVRTAQQQYQARVGGTTFNTAPRKYPATRWSAIAFTFSGNSLRISDENGEQSGTCTMTTETLLGGMLNDVNAGGASAFQEMHAFMVFPTALDSATVAKVRAELLLAFGVEQAALARRVIYVGDSRVEGSQSLLGNTFSYQCDALLGVDAQSFNMGIFGEQLIAFTLGKYFTEVAPLYKPGAVVCMLSGFNDLTAGAATGQAVYNATVAYCNAARATGFKIAVGTVLGSYSMTADQLAQLQSLNTLLRANWRSFADGFVDQEAVPDLSITGGYSTASVWAGDRVHLQSAGQGLQAAAAAPVLTALLAA